MHGREVRERFHISIPLLGHGFVNTNAVALPASSFPSRFQLVLKPVSTSVGRRRRREARGFAKILQRFLSSRATTSSRPPAPAAIEAPRVCLGPKQTDFFSCGVYTCWAALCETVALELGAQWCPGFE